MDLEKRRTDQQLHDLLERFARRAAAIPVDFRRLVPWLPDAASGAHFIHRYPAKLLMHIPHFFLANGILSSPGDLVLDPFCGSGTVLLEALLANRKAIGVDVNPLAQLVAKVKTTAVTPTKLAAAASDLRSALRSHRSRVDPPDVVNLEYWFHPHVIQKLSVLREVIETVASGSVRRVLRLCLSACAGNVSLTDPRVAVPVRLRPDRYPRGHWLRKRLEDREYSLKRVNVFELYFKMLDKLIQRLISRQLEGSARAIVHCRPFHSGRAQLEPGSVQLAITSPPYVGAQKYIRSSSLHLGWLGFGGATKLRALDEQSIGREHHHVHEYTELAGTDVDRADRVLARAHRANPLRAHIAATYLNEMRVAISSITTALKPQGFLVLIVANNCVARRSFRTAEFLRQIAEEEGLRLVLNLVDDIRSRGLMTRRNNTASVITREHVLLFQKTGLT